MLKIWNPNTGTAIATLEQHEDKVWGLDSYEYNNKLHFISGSADGKLVIWKDSSLEESQQRKEEMQLKVN